ncbi:MAG: ABC transporter permease, partial [Chloroflexi bacterium]|nr:ABC transporter permease [Chloroflexota bacterium]
LFLVVVALFFMRLFPLFVRYIGGESPGLVHLLTGLSVAGLAGGTLFLNYQGGTLSEAYVPAAIALAVGASYYVTHRFIQGRWKWIGVGAQAAAVAAYALTGDIQPSNALFLAEVGLLAIVPALVLYRLLTVMTRSAPAWLSISLWHMARNPLQYTWLVLLLVLVTGLGIFATTVGGTLTRSQDEQIQFRTPTDMRIQGTPLFLSEGLGGMLEGFIETPAIDSGALGYRTSASLGNVSMQLLALEPDAFAKIAWFRDDFADARLEQIMELVAVTDRPEGITLPEDSQGIGLWIRPIEPQPLMSAWAVVQDSEGVVKTVSLGEVGELEWHKVSGRLPDDLTGPFDLMAISLYEPGTSTQSSGGGTPGTVLFDDVHAVRSDGSEVILEGFEGDIAWSPIPTSLFNSDVLFTTNESFNGVRSGVFRFGTDRNRSVRGIYEATGGGVIPAVISQEVADVTGLRAGMTQIVSVSGWLVPVEVAGVIDLFPTLDTTNSGFMLADIDALLSYMNMMSQISSVEPNELYLRKSGEAPEIVEEITNEMESILLKVSDTTEQREEIRRDPLQNAGWRALVFMALAVVLLAAIFGYVAYMLLVGESSEHEMGFLQSLGLSKIQLLGLLSFEHLTVVVLGLGVGTWAGFQMSRLMVAPLAVSDIGQSIVPPFILVTDWSLMLPTYAMILAIFMTVMFILYRSIGRTKLFELARTGEA